MQPIDSGNPRALAVGGYHVDGSSPKEKVYPSAFCVFRGNKLIKSKVLNERINVYEIEFMALIEGLKLAEPYSIIYSDNKEVVDEINLKRPKKNEDFENAQELIREKNLEVKKINRGNNPAGIYLELRLKKLVRERKSIMHPKPNPQWKRNKKRKFYMKGKSGKFKKRNK